MEAKKKEADEKFEKMMAESKYKSLEITSLTTQLDNEKQKCQTLRDNITQLQDLYKGDQQAWNEEKARLVDQIEIHKHKFSIKVPFDSNKKENNVVNVTRLDLKRTQKQREIIVIIGDNVISLGRNLKVIFTSLRHYIEG